jgi:uncharacterized protein DUF397
MDLTGADWCKSSYSSNAGGCVDVARNLLGIVAVRDSKNTAGPALVFPAGAWRAFVAALRDVDEVPAARR